MKIYIVGLVSLIVLTACVRYPTQFHTQIQSQFPIQTPTAEDEKSDIPGFSDFCEDKDLVLVVYVNKEGKSKRKRCPGIELLEELPDDVNEPTGRPSTLGGTQKWRNPKNPKDPCIQWEVNGWPYFYCWDLPTVSR